MKTLLSILRWLGRRKFFAMRVRDYLNVVSLFMVADLWLKANGFSWFWFIVVGSPLFVVLYLADKYGVYPGEADAAVTGTRWYQELIKLIQSQKETK